MEITPLHSSLGNKSETQFKKKNFFLKSEKMLPGKREARGQGGLEEQVQSSWNGTHLIELRDKEKPM